MRQNKLMVKSRNNSRNGAFMGVVFMRFPVVKTIFTTIIVKLLFVTIISLKGQFVLVTFPNIDHSNYVCLTMLLHIRSMSVTCV